MNTSTTLLINVNKTFVKYFLGEFADTLLSPRRALGSLSSHILSMFVAPIHIQYRKCGKSFIIVILILPLSFRLHFVDLIYSIINLLKFYSASIIIVQIFCYSIQHGILVAPPIWIIYAQNPLWKWTLILAREGEIINIKAA